MNSIKSSLVEVLVTADLPTLSTIVEAGEGFVENLTGIELSGELENIVTTA